MSKLDDVFTSMSCDLFFAASVFPLIFYPSVPVALCSGASKEQGVGSYGLILPHLYHVLSKAFSNSMVACGLLCLPVIPATSELPLKGKKCGILLGCFPAANGWLSGS